MEKKKEYLIELTNKINRTIKHSSSFTYVYETLSLDKFKLNVKYNYDETIKRCIELKNLLNKITSIVFKPHIKASTNEVILRSEFASSLSNQSFNDTLKDSKLWKNKNGVMTPEYVHSLEFIDSIDTYENRFISLLITLIEDEVEYMLSNIFPLVESIEEHFEVNGITYGEHSLFKEFSRLDYPYNDVFKKEKGNPNKVYTLVRMLLKRVKQLKNTEFFKITHKYIDKNIIPTNILIHDELYSYCFRFYKANYLNVVTLSSMNEYYYNYCLLCFFKYLSSLNIAKTAKSNNATLRVDASNRLRFDDISFKKGMFSYLIKEDQENLGFFMEVRLIEKAIRTNTKVGEERIARYYFLTSKTYSKENEVSINKEIENKKLEFNNVILLTQNNIVRNFSSVLTLSIYKDNHDLLFKNLLSSLSMLFKTDTMIFEAKCPVCGSSDLTYDGFTYKCSKCGSTYSLLNIDNEDILWVKSFRR